MKTKNNLTVGYFVKTLLFVLLVPNILFLLITLLSNFLLSHTYDIEGERAIRITSVFIAAFVPAYLYGSKKTGLKKPVKVKLPKTLLWLYMPVFIPFIWHFIARIIILLFMNEYYRTSDLLFYNDIFIEEELFLCFDLCGATLPFFLNIRPFAGHLITDALLIAGFAAGERITAKESENKRRFRITKFIVIAAIAAVMTAGIFWMDSYGVSHGSVFGSGPYDDVLNSSPFEN